MAIVFHRGLVIPLWAIAFCAVALSTPARVMLSLMALAGVAVIASTMPAIIRWGRPSRPPVELLPATDRNPAPAGMIMAAGTRTRTLEEAIDTRTLKADDAADLVRMDDDGGWQTARQPALTDSQAHGQDQRLP